jgi:hypothetical protein
MSMKAQYLLALIAVTGIAVADDEKRPATERLKEKTASAVETTKDTAKRAVDAVAERTRDAWSKTKAFFSDDPAVYKDGATKRLNEIAAELEELKSSSAEAPAYFRTRLKALEQHHAHAVEQLAALGAADLKREKGSKRSQLDKTIERLDDQLDVARKECKDFTAK